MDVGIQMIFTSHGWPGISDGQVYDEELRLALLAEDLGFDVLWSVEHHFFDYSFCPDNTELLAYLAGGRLRFGMGRGLSRREFAGFRGIEMDESRDRFDEGSAMVLEALRTGFIEGNGPYYPQARTEI